jgi:hypothetical protein
VADLKATTAAFELVRDDGERAQCTRIQRIDSGHVQNEPIRARGDHVLERLGQSAY